MSVALQLDYEELVAKGVEFGEPPRLQPYAALEIVPRDPDGSCIRSPAREPLGRASDWRTQSMLRGSRSYRDRLLSMGPTLSGEPEGNASRRADGAGGVVRPGDSTARNSASDKVLYGLIALAVLMSAGHHVDHVIRGNNVGWPIDPQVNAFTYSLAIYPLVLVGLLLYRAGKVGPGFWVFLSAGGALFVGFIHFAPAAIEPPSEIVDPYDRPLLGWLAFAWLVVFVAVLVLTTVYEALLLRRRRDQGTHGVRRSPGATR
jgi:hypothetical protein